ncbi:MAG: hypothetical protein COV75_02065 [Candidatus Omnitrophica bacterium CG11_big_fil_rev_8_21_14_0_20_63_9]|nr:MAG: hypothetical protein COV75_02065 [Candidatus Omnitrophica bacterium CG11_big_fil_rev_8_21_14_0_20_63_9]
MTDLDALHTAGVEGIRWFMIPDGRNLTFDADRTPTGRGAGFTEDLHRALDLLSERQMSVIITLLDGNYWFKPEDEFQGALFGHARSIIEPAKRQALYTNVIIPILEDIKAWHAQYPDTPSPVAAIDLGNELENGVNSHQQTGVSLVHLQTYVRETAALIHQRLPGVPVTVGATSAQSLVNVWTDAALGVAAGQGQDFYSFHHYGFEPLQGPNGLRARFGLDQLGKRIYLQEFPGNNAPLGEVEIYLAPIGGTRQGRMGEGWLSGSYMWSLNGANDGATPADPIATMQRITAWFNNAFHRPDLTITNLVVPGPITETDPVQFDFTIVNQGGVTAVPSRFELWLDGALLEGLILPAIEPGDTHFLTAPATPWPSTGGTHDLWSKVDVWLQLEEADETNNERTATLQVAPSLRPDLVVAAITPTAPYLVGAPTQWSVTVTNQGASAAAENRFELWLDGVQLAATTVPTLNANQSTTFVVPATPWTATAGEHNLWGKADVLLEIVEGNEINNERTVTFALAALDVSVSGQVTDAQTAAAVPNALIEVRLGPGKRRIAYTRTTVGGTYRFPRIANGTYLVRVVKNGYKTTKVPLTVSGTPVTLNVALPKRR